MRSIFTYVPTFLCMIVGTHTASAQDALIPIDEKYFAKDVEDLVVDLGDADVIINTSSESTLHVQVVVDGHDLDQAYEYFEKQNYSVNLDQLTLRIISDPDRSYGSSSSWRNSTDIEVIMTMPSDIPITLRISDGDLNIDDLTADALIQTSDGDISIGSITGDLIRIQTSDGDIDAELLNSSAITVKTSDGDLSLGTLMGDSIRLQSSDGDIMIDLATGNIEGKTSDGDFEIYELISAKSELRTSDGEINISQVTGNLTVSSGDGDIKLGLVNPDEVNVTVSDGDIQISLPFDLSATLDIYAEDVSMNSYENFSGDRDNTRIDGDLNGGGSIIRVRTSDGDVQLKRIDD